MLSSWIQRGIRQQEETLGVPLDYLHYINQHDPVAVAKLGLIKPLATHRRRLPPEALHLARLQAIRVEDCGECVQIEVNLARKAGVPPEFLRAVLSEQLENLPSDLADVVRFAFAVAVSASDEDGLRERLRQRYGDAGLVELCLGIASARFFPTLKRALGYSQSCSLIRVAVPA
ncbi:MAG: hypothetical protein JNK85_03310 [Verrucomicrobiales bacterium]|nr:hypothetical protein [Verrucomicrobiales bacterium]